MTTNDTICALATAAGGAIAVIRISGPQALASADAICSASCTASGANSIHYNHIVDSDGTTLDEVMVSIFHAPHSYTGEDAVEISCHGSRYIVNRVLKRLTENGCRMARPGEYTMRAYLNGKLDLSQAEAVADLIASTNRATHQLAISQLKGHFSSELARLRDQLLHLTSLLELELDFSDHEDLEFADRKELQQLANAIDERVSKLVQSFETGQALKQGIPVAIVGRTNVGKSTLLNRLLKDERAIVSDIHGTTRDTIEDTININDATFRFIDTAGLRQTDDVVEQMGIERTYQAICRARIVLWVTDTTPSAEELAEMTKQTEGKALIVVRNKIDQLKKTETNPSVIKISAKTGEGLSTLETAIYEAADIPEISDLDIIVSNVRHYDVLLRARTHLQRVIKGLKNNLSGDLLAEDLRFAIETLAEITGGQITTNEVLENIFQHFCVGK